MKRILSILLAGFFLVSCGQSSENEVSHSSSEEHSEPDSSSQAPSSVDAPDSVTYSLQSTFEDITFEEPLALVFHPEDHTPYVVERTGRIYRIENQEKELFIDLSTLVQADGQEQGLLGFAFDPNFATSQRFYVNYTAENQTHISRFLGEEELPINIETEEIILSFDQPYSNHNGGHLAFGPDDYLYIATGDGGSAGDPMYNAQRTNNLLGKILRIDVSSEEAYLNPKDNRTDEIFAYGFRNPWRFSFDNETGNLWVADVGQDSREEINIVENGRNYGWNIFEGTQDYDSEMMMDGTTYYGPIWEYDHTQGQSITGGYVYRGEQFPELYGMYLYGDLVSGTIWALETEDNQVVENHELLQTDLRIASFGEDPDGEIYVVDFSGVVYSLSR